MKALIPAAGLGTRYLPLTKAVPKELIPVGKFPVLHHVVAEAKAAGCDEIGIILSEGKEAIKQYFSWDEGLMALLDAQGKRSAMSEWERLMDGLSFTWIDQAEQKGLGDAISCGEAFADGEPVCILLGDTIIRGDSPLSTMISRMRETGFSQVSVEPVEYERATRYGVCGGDQVREGVFELDKMIEKPSVDEIPAMRQSGEVLPGAYAFAARYVLTNNIFTALKSIPTGRNNEIQLTDAMASVLASHGFGAVRLLGERLDIGTPDSSMV